MDNLSRSQRNGLVAEPLDRLAHMRTQDQWLDRVARSARSRFLPVYRNLNLITAGGTPRARLLTRSELNANGIPPECLILLGEDANHLYFAVPVNDDAAAPGERLSETGRFVDLRTTAAVLEDRDAALLAYARGMTYWHRTHQYCGSCGTRNRSLRAGHLLVCTNSECQASHFPHTDPAVIVLVHEDDRCLLGRKSEWPAQRYSTIAGFVEPGETVEQAVVREVREETGVEVGSVAYHSSQPWPFPGAVMLGYHARPTTTHIHTLDDELEDARWFSREQVSDAIAKRGPLRLPPRISIARRLIEDWHDGRFGGGRTQPGG